MKRLLLTLILGSFLVPFSHAENDSLRNVFLNVSNGIGYAQFRDYGASPITLRGLEVLPGMSLKIERQRWQYEASFDLSGGGYGFKVGVSAFHTYGVQPIIAFSALRKVVQTEHWGLLAGASVDETFDFKYYSALGNSSTGISNFLRANIVTQVEYRLSRLSCHFRLSMNPISSVFRPGYTYMDNYNQYLGSPAVNLFDQYVAYGALLTGVSTRLGATWHLKNGNRLGVEYQWSYLNSRISNDGVSAPFTFEQAAHGVVFELGFKL